MDAKDPPTGLGTVAEGSERKASSASRGRRGGRGRGGANNAQPPADPNRAAGSATGDEGVPRSNRRRPTRPLQTPLSPPVSRGIGSVDLDSAGRGTPQQRPPPPSPHLRGGHPPPRPNTPKNRPANTPAAGGASFPAGSVGGNPVSGGGGPRPPRPRPPRPVRPIHNATAASSAPASAPNNNTEQARPARLNKDAPPPHPVQPRPKPRADPAVVPAANPRVRPKHKSAGKLAVVVAGGPGDSAIASVPSYMTPAPVATEDLPTQAIMPKTPQKTPNKPKPGLRESPKKKGAANYAQGNSSKGVPPLDKTENSKADETNGSTGSVSRPQPALQQTPPPPKPVTKVAIRWLPVDLPEHVFWRSVETALPWFDSQQVGAVVQKERLVLRELNSGPEAIGTNAEATANTKPETTPDQGSVPKGESEAECDPQPSLEAVADDVLPLSLGATTTTMVDVYESGNLSRLDSEPYWRAFIPGKQHQSRAKPADPSRAYILFAMPAEVDHFYRHYHGHAFSKNGSVSRAVVELAAFQHAPWSIGTSAGDMLSGTIDEDPDFIAFLATDTDALADAKATAGDGVVAAGTKPLSHVSYAAAALSSSINGGPEGAKEVTTPLISYLRELKGKSSGARSANRPSAQSAAQGKPATAAASSSAKAPASAQSRSGDATLKRTRRRNR
ncbi:hypothetical protein IWW37_004687 [Coemansia sp. RSA 2050]|nr:hypothetical protein IWW37_004687 [Coemansia sp. RSA 2050]KAJ2735236.1 hypothetical protein IW152_001755 [Coemansia sp. BCRC 34962]